MSAAAASVGAVAVVPKAEKEARTPDSVADDGGWTMSEAEVVAGLKAHCDAMKTYFDVEKGNKRKAEDAFHQLARWLARPRARAVAIMARSGDDGAPSWSTVLRRCRFLVVEKLESKKTDVERLAALTRCALEAAGVESLTVGKRGKAAADLLLQDALGALNHAADPPAPSVRLKAQKGDSAHQHYVELLRLLVERAPILGRLHPKVQLPEVLRLCFTWLAGETRGDGVRRGPDAEVVRSNPPLFRLYAQLLARLVRNWHGDMPVEWPGAGDGAYGPLGELLDFVADVAERGPDAWPAALQMVQRGVTADGPR